MKKIWKFIATNWGRTSGSWAGFDTRKEARQFTENSENCYIYDTLKEIKEDVAYYQKLVNEGRSDFRPRLKVLKEIISYHS